jgi:hypothetical protein
MLSLIIPIILYTITKKQIMESKNTAILDVNGYDKKQVRIY